MKDRVERVTRKDREYEIRATSCETGLVVAVFRADNGKKLTADFSIPASEADGLDMLMSVLKFQILEGIIDPG